MVRLPNGKCISFNGNLYANHDGNIEWILTGINYRYLENKMDNIIQTYHFSAVIEVLQTGTLITNLPQASIGLYYINAKMTDDFQNFMSIYVNNTNLIMQGRNFTYGYVLFVNNTYNTLYNNDGNVSGTVVNNQHTDIFGRYGYSNYHMSVEINGIYIA